MKKNAGKSREGIPGKARDQKKRTGGVKNDHMSTHPPGLSGCCKAKRLGERMSCGAVGIFHEYRRYGKAITQMKAPRTTGTSAGHGNEYDRSQVRRTKVAAASSNPFPQPPVDPVSRPGT
ncbi:hypothetical protein BDM02DRAFT_3112879 [Thelephora ganbajun]|uniref:Uncharacterized protein n=2 Tax=Thelephora ganbajun TaxID=370292 RepID=A0ACB6ZJY5_THEGA|nr:hypothetical protein BDM02DRAFT_3112862 [Thelephora ganbajun]KAF9649898.1 hypothetical protein BDM02DRAFT_3112879 [Thelephora ganbajun]